MTDKEKIEELVKACKAALIEMYECIDSTKEPEYPPSASVIKQIKIAIAKAEDKETDPNSWYENVCPDRDD